MEDEPETYAKESVTRVLLRCFHALVVQAPAEGKFPSHSIRIGSHTEQVLLGISLPVYMARFGWGNSSEEFCTLYFDRTIRTSGASVWVFRCAVRSGNFCLWAACYRFHRVFVKIASPDLVNS